MIRTLLVTLLLSCAMLRAGETGTQYLDPKQPLELRVKDLVSRMTLEEKASLMQNSTPGVPRLGIPKYDWWSEALHGVANSGIATVFPQAIGLASMWNEDLHQEIAGTVGVEGRAKFNSYVGTEQEGALFRGLTFWSPNINIFRDPRWGRGQETYGEDPFLTARLGVAFVRGLQGNHASYLQAAACAKHFAVHSGPEPLRHKFDAAPSAVDLRETYLPAFEALVREAKVEIVMTAYNSLYGIPCSVSELLYSELKKWGFNGHVTSDCGSVADLIHSYKLAADEAEAETLVLAAGMNLTCGGEAHGIVKAVRTGMLDEAVVNERVSPLLRTMFRLGFFDPKDKVPFNGIKPEENDSPAHAALALRASRESIVLLKNDGVLPLNTGKLRRVAVIGPNASSVPALLGNYNGSPSKPVTILQGLKTALEPGVEVVYAHGCDYAARPEAARPIPGIWWNGEFYSNKDLSGSPVAKRTERPLNFDLCNCPSSRGNLPPGVPKEGISVRWKGDLQTTLPGDYELVLKGRGGFRLTLGDELLIDAWTPQPGEESREREFRATRRLPGNASLPIKLEYAQGKGDLKVSLDWTTPKADSCEAEALEAAKTADLIVFVGGISAQLEGEEMEVDYEGFVGGDRTRIELPALQQQLLRKLHATGKPLVFVNLSGSAVAFPWEAENMNAILQAWYPGQAGGTAVAEILLGKYNPAGRLPLTFYRSTQDLPAFEDYSMAGRTYRYFKGTPLYPFGHGLSYTRFSHDKLSALPASEGDLEVSVEVRNTGERAGDEVVQLYATPPANSLSGETQSLCGFKRVHLAAGEARTVKIRVPSTALRRWNDGKKAYEVPAGEWTLLVGSSSADIKARCRIEL